MRMPPARLPALAAAAALLLAGPAFAHAQLVSSNPAANARLAEAPKVITLTFNEKLTPASMKVELAMTDHNMKVPVKAALAKDGRSVTVTPQGPLMKGAYRLAWTAAGPDGHKMSGEVAFRVG